LEKITNLQSESRKEIGDKGLARLRMSHTGFLSLLGLTGNRKPKSESTAIAGGLRDLVMEQHRTLFYTVTISTPPAAAANPTPPSAERQLLVAPALKEKTLKWQCATSLSKSQSVISRTNSNSNLYYTLAFLGEGDGTSHEGCRVRGVGRDGASSPVRIYIQN